MRRVKFIRGMVLVIVVLMLVGLLPTASTKLVFAGNQLENGNVPSVTTFATPDDLMTVFDLDGTDDTVGKIIFGKNERGEAQEWYIAGKDSGVSGDNITLFAVSYLVEDVVFEEYDSPYKTFEANLGSIYETAPSTVGVNHYGTSDVYVKLTDLENDTRYFSTTEQTVMNEITISTNDRYNNTEYTNNDKLYLLSIDPDDMDTIYAGSKDENPIDITYWGSDWFWLRTPHINYQSIVYIATPNGAVGNESVDWAWGYDIHPACNLNLSSALFSSGAQVSLSDSTGGIIPDETAMILRLDGSNIAIGSAVYDADKGIIAAAKASEAVGTVALVVQGNNGSDDWYYSKVIDERELISTADIIETLAEDITLTEVSLEDCKIWIETTHDNVAYANMATAGTIINHVEITEVEDPISEQLFDIEAKTATAGLTTQTPEVKWTAGNSEAADKADYNTAYTASVTLTADEDNDAIFSSDVTATINGKKAEVKLNPDGTITVSYEFATAKRRITAIAAPSLPKDNTFTSYYTAEEVLSSTELNDEVTVTLEGELVPITVNMDVEWSLVDMYDATPGVTNIFKWKVKADEYVDYDISNTVMEGIVSIKNKAAIEVPPISDPDLNVSDPDLGANALVWLTPVAIIVLGVVIISRQINR